MPAPQGFDLYQAIWRPLGPKPEGNCPPPITYCMLHGVMLTGVGWVVCEGGGGRGGARGEIEVDKSPFSTHSHPRMST